MKNIILASSLFLSFSILACPGGSYDLDRSHTLMADKIVVNISETRRTLIEPIVGTQFTAIDGEKLGATYPKVEVIDQESDDQGIFYTTYSITSRVIYPGAVDKVKKVKVNSNYNGNGLYSRGGCSVEILD